MNKFTRRLQNANRGFKNMQIAKDLRMRENLRIEKSRCKAKFSYLL